MHKFIAIYIVYYKLKRSRINTYYISYIPLSLVVIYFINLK